MWYGLVVVWTGSSMDCDGDDDGNIRKKLVERKDGLDMSSRGRRRGHARSCVDYLPTPAPLVMTIWTSPRRRGAAGGLRGSGVLESWVDPRHTNNHIRSDVMSIFTRM